MSTDDLLTQRLYAAEQLAETSSRSTEPLNRADIDQIVEAIEQFVIGDNDDLDPVWRPYIDKLEALKATLPPTGLQRCWTCLGTGEDADTDGAGSWTRMPCGTCDGTGLIPIKAAARLNAILEAQEARPAPPLDKDVWRRFAAALLYAQQNDHSHVVIGVETASAIEATIRPAPPAAHAAPTE